LFLGLIEGLAEGTPALVKYFSGALSDRVKNRKWLVLCGYSLSSAVKPFIGLTKYAVLGLAPIMVLGLRLLDKIGKGIRGAPRDALVADFSEGRQGRAFGFQRGMDHLGALGGGLVAFILLSAFRLDLVWVIALSAIPGLATILTILLFVHDRPERRAPAGRAPGGTADAPLSRVFHFYLVASVLFSMANSSDAFLLLRAQEMGLEWMYLPLAWAVLHAVKTVTSFAGGALSDRIGRRPVLTFGWLLYAGVYAAFAQLESPAAAFLLFAVYGVFFGATEGVAKAFVADLVPQGLRGRAFGWLGLVEGLMLIPTSMAAGLLWDLTGSGILPLTLNAGFALCATVWLLLFVRAPEREAGQA
jgi:MFS family permease